MSTNFRIVQTPTIDGTTVYSEYAPAPGRDTAAVLLHGFGENGSAWLGTREALGDLCSVLALDLRGHGNSEASKCGRYDIEVYVADVLAVLEQLALERVILVGHSLGAWVAAHVAAQRPDLVRALVLVDLAPDTSARASANVLESLQQRLRGYESFAEYREWLLANRQLLTPASAEKLAQAALREVGGAFELKVDPALAKQHTLGLDSASVDLARLLLTIACPSVIMRGAASAFLSASAARTMAAQLGNCEIITIPRAGHGVMADNPAVFNHALAGFVQSVLKGAHLRAAQLRST